jgi:hypothetical protein
VKRAIVSIAASLLASCSLAAMRSPSKQVSHTVEPDCSASRGPVVADAIGGTIAGSIAITGVAEGGLDNNQGKLVIGLSSALTLVSLLSAVHGVDVSNKCREFQVQWHERRDELDSVVVPIRAGREGGRCRRDAIQVCEPGLTCASGYCVEPPPAIASDDELKRQAEVIRRRQAASALAARAREAAVAENCEVARDLVAQVQRADTGIYARLVTNAAVQACLTPPE